MNKHVVVIGTSAGGVEALKSLLYSIPKNFSAPITIVMYISLYSVSHLPNILRQSSQLSIITPYDGQKLKASEVYKVNHRRAQKEKI